MAPISHSATYKSDGLGFCSDISHATTTNATESKKNVAIMVKTSASHQGTTQVMMAHAIGTPT